AFATFDASRLLWEEREREPHAGILRLHAALLGLRRSMAGWPTAPHAVDVTALDDDTVALLRRSGSGGGALLVVARLRGTGLVDVGAWPPVSAYASWTRVLATEDETFAAGRFDADGSARI